jgi:cytochrome c
MEAAAYTGCAKARNPRMERKAVDAPGSCPRGLEKTWSAGDMNSFEFNKIAGAILGVLTFTMLVSFASELLFAEKKAKVAGYALPGLEAKAATAPAAGPAAEPIAKRLATAEAAKGAETFRQCTACHTPDKGGANKVGPNLWAVLDRAKGAVAGFGYSNALKTVAGKGEKWTYDALDRFLENPKGYMPGTSMSYNGIQNPATRANMVAYLRSLADTPAPLPAN